MAEPKGAQTNGLLLAGAVVEGNGQSGAAQASRAGDGKGKKRKEEVREAENAMFGHGCY